MEHWTTAEGLLGNKIISYTIIRDGVLKSEPIYFIYLLSLFTIGKSCLDINTRQSQEERLPSEMIY